MKMNDRQVQNKRIFSLGKSTKTGEMEREKRMGVTDEGQRKGDGGVAKEKNRGDR